MNVLRSTLKLLQEELAYTPGDGDGFVGAVDALKKADAATAEAITQATEACAMMKTVIGMAEKGIGDNSAESIGAAMKAMADTVAEIEEANQAWVVAQGRQKRAIDRFKVTHEDWRRRRVIATQGKGKM